MRIVAYDMFNKTYNWLAVAISMTCKFHLTDPIDRNRWELNFDRSWRVFLCHDRSKFSEIDECKSNQSNTRNNLMERVRLILSNELTNLSKELTNSNSGVNYSLRLTNSICIHPKFSSHRFRSIGSVWRNLRAMATLTSQTQQTFIF